MSEHRSCTFGELSGGQRQRVIMARALAHGGQVMLLDEPLTGVDATSGRILQESMARLRDRGVTLLVATHDLNDAARTCDRLLFLNRRVMAYGTPDETYTAETLSRTYEGILVVSDATGRRGSACSTRAPHTTTMGTITNTPSTTTATGELADRPVVDRARHPCGPRVDSGRRPGRRARACSWWSGDCRSRSRRSHTPCFPARCSRPRWADRSSLGGLAAGLAAATGIAFASRAARTSDETAIGVVFTGMFALGVLLASALGPLDQDISSFLFGDLLGVSRSDLVASIGLAILVVGVLLALRRPLIAGSFDRDAAAAAGMRPRSDRHGPAVPAGARRRGRDPRGRHRPGPRIVCDPRRLSPFGRPAASGQPSAAAIGYGVASGIGGLYLSFHADVAAGGAVVLVATGLFALTWLASPRSGPLAAVRRIRAAQPAPR